MSEGASLLRLHLKAAKILFAEEFRFCKTRRWRFDFALANGFAIEIEGGIWVAGRHSRGEGMEADMEKYNQAALQGWRVLRFSTAMVKSGVAIRTIEEALK